MSDYLMYGQIRKIKEESKENQKSQKPKPKPKPKLSGRSKPKPKPVPKPPQEKHRHDPITIIYPTPDPVYSVEPISSSPESYDFDGCFYTLGCLNPAPFFEKLKFGVLDTMSWDEIDPTFVSWDLRANFDIGYHYDSEWHYTYVDYLPGVRMNLGFIMFDYRYNILTEYTDGNPDSFKSWELLVLFNLLPRKDLKIFLGTGIHREKFSKQNFNEHYLGAKVGVLNNKNHFDLDVRFSVDYKTGAFPFFETGIRYNKRLMNVNNLFGYITIGPIYQNYYQAHDIWSLRGGIIVNIH